MTHLCSHMTICAVTWHIWAVTWHLCSHMTHLSSHMTHLCSHMTHLSSHMTSEQSHDSSVQSHDTSVQSHDLSNMFSRVWYIYFNVSPTSHITPQPRIDSQTSLTDLMYDWWMAVTSPRAEWRCIVEGSGVPSVRWMITLVSKKETQSVGSWVHPCQRYKYSHHLVSPTPC